MPYVVPPTQELSMAHQQSQQQQQQHQQQQPLQHQQAQQQMYPPDSEQKLVTPELFSLENYYWNDFQTGAAQQVGEQYYQDAHPANNEMAAQAPGMQGQVTGVYYDVLRLLQEDGRGS